MKRGLKLIAAIFLASLTAITLTTCGGGGGGSGDGGGGGSSGGGGSNSGGGGGGSSTSSVIGTSGGSVTLNDVTVNIPANLLSQDAKVTLTEISPSALQIDNSSVLGTLVQITIEPVGASSTSAARDVQIKSLLGDVKQSMTFYWNNIDEAKAAIFGSTCLATEIVTVIAREFKFLNMPCKLSNSTAMVTVALFLQWNTSLQKLFGTYALLSPTQLRELNTPPSLKSFALTDANQQGESREFDNSPLNGRTPVILIHGINRDENLGMVCSLNNSDKERFWCYEYKRNVWNTFYEEAAKLTGFYNKFKVYEYVYPSFKSSSSDNGPSLSSMIQNDPELAKSKIFLVAHSFGGLVARRAMNVNDGVLGNQTINLFTLATPHHGSIGASLLNFNQTTNNDAIADSWLSDKKTLIALTFGKIYYSLAVETQGYMELRWDNFDGGIPQHWTDNVNVSTSTNGLKTFNETGDKFKGKIITYSGGNIGALDPTVVNEILNSSDLSDALGKIPNTISINRVLLWFSAEAIKRFGDYNDDSNPPNYPDSDGMVPRSSANFEAGGVTNDLVLDDVDHEQIFDDVRFINNIQNKMLSTYIVSGTVTSNGVGLAGVTISWSVTNGSGGGGSYATTDSNGNYQLGIQNGYTYTITPSMSGYTFTPSSRTGTVNSADVTGQDFVGTTLTSDTTPPTVSSTSPANGATGIAINSTISATFSEAMDASTITTATFTIAGITGTVTYSGTTATFTPSSNLAYNTTYTATITTGVRDTSGNAMASNYSWNFTTGGVATSTIADSGPSWSPDGTKIAFVSNRDGNNEIYVMNADGTNQTRLTYNNADDIQPSWSPDGTKIAFRTYRDGNSEVYVMNADGTNLVNLTNNLDNYDGEPRWSPDGSKIVFSSWRSGAADIWVMNSDGTNPLQLTYGLWASNPAWSPDGTRIAFSYRGNISVMNADGTNQTTILSVGCCISPYVGSWSPDGTKIAIFSDRFDGNFEIYTINSDGTNRVRLTNNSASDTEPSWSPSAAKIAFGTNRDGNYEIYTMNPDGTNQTRLTNN